MAKPVAAAAESKPSLFERVKTFYQEVVGEMGKVTWPTKDELKSNTTVVLFLLAVVAAIIYVYDVVFQFFVIGLFKLV